MTSLTRQTNETNVRVRLRTAQDGDGGPSIATSDAFLDHMLATLARYAGLTLDVTATGDLRHHLIEDVAITLGLALREETAIRFGVRLLPLLVFTIGTLPLVDEAVRRALGWGRRSTSDPRLDSAGA